MRAGTARLAHSEPEPIYALAHSLHAGSLSDAWCCVSVRPRVDRFAVAPIAHNMVDGNADTERKQPLRLLIVVLTKSNYHLGQQRHTALSVDVGPDEPSDMQSVGDRASAGSPCEEPRATHGKDRRNASRSHGILRRHVRLMT
jgi:hypothetical protein